jgi:hypothetical protein
MPAPNVSGAASWSTVHMVKSNRKFLTAALGIGALLLLSSALAAPPQSRLPQPRSIASQIPQLDLRAPSIAAEAAERSISFPSLLHRHNSQSQEQIRLPALGSAETRSRPSIREFVQRTRREGLPVARLFESKSALVHLGLSPKGKPGLWLVQKTR